VPQRFESINSQDELTDKKISVLSKGVTEYTENSKNLLVPPKPVDSVDLLWNQVLKEEDNDLLSGMGSSNGDQEEQQ
jgi:hypothetical protein